MEPRNADTRIALLQAALACFAERGFDGTSLRQIAEAAGRPLSLISHYFGSKEGLYLEVFKFMLEASEARRGKAGLICPPDPRDPAGAVRLLREQIHFMYRRAAHDAAEADPLQDAQARLWLQEFRSPRASLQPLLKTYLGPATEMVRACIRVLRPELGEAQVAFLGQTVLGQVASHGFMSGLNRVLWGEYPPFGSPFQEAELLVDFCLHGLRGESWPGTAEA